MEKVLGKIKDAQFGFYSDRQYLMGLQLNFSMSGSGVGCGGKYTVNISENCKWDSKEQKAEAISKLLLDLNHLLASAKVAHVSQLVNKPVEIELENGLFKGFRILTEVL